MDNIGIVPSSSLKFVENLPVIEKTSQGRLYPAGTYFAYMPSPIPFSKINTIDNAVVISNKQARLLSDYSMHWIVASMNENSFGIISHGGSLLTILLTAVNRRIKSQAEVRSCCEG
jgi:hypothetical protein